MLDPPPGYRAITALIGNALVPASLQRMTNAGITTKMLHLGPGALYYLLNARN